MSKAVPFNAQMARANRMKIKTNTRRLVPKKFTSCIDLSDGKPFIEDDYGKFIPLQDLAPWQPGDILWQREPAKVINTWFEFDCPLLTGDSLEIKFLADGANHFRMFPKRISDRWNKTDNPASNLPNWISKKQGIPNGIFKELCRTWLKVTGVRAHQLQDISQTDAAAEGIEREYDDETWKFLAPDGSEHGDPRCAFMRLWDSLAKPGFKFADNPWVWSYSYEPCDKPEGWC